MSKQRLANDVSVFLSQTQNPPPSLLVHIAGWVHHWNRRPYTSPLGAFGDKGRPNPCRPTMDSREQGISKVGDHINANPNTTRSEHHHVRWELEQVMTRVRPEDLSATEIAALLAILRPAHARVVGGPASRPGLRILSSDYPAPKLA